MARPSKLHMHRGQWRVRIAGKEHYLGTDRTKAEAAFHRLLAAKLEKSDGSFAYVGEFIAEWIAAHPSASQARKLREFTAFAGETHKSEVGRDFLVRYLRRLRKVTYQPGGPKGKAARRGYSNETISNYVSAASQVLTYAHNLGWIADKPLYPDMPKPLQKSRDVPIAKIDEALTHVRDHARRILRFIAATGCRPGEARALKWGNIRDGAVILGEHKTVEETGEERIFGITDEAQVVLDEFDGPRLPQAYVFTNRDGKPYTGGGLRSILRRQGILPNQLRHSWAQSMIDAGGREDVVADQLGHKSTKTTKRYCRVRAARAAANAARMRLVRQAV